MVADDGQTMVDTSKEASLQADSAPATPPTPLISLWQQNLLGIKAETVHLLADASRRRRAGNHRIPRSVTSTNRNVEVGRHISPRWPTLAARAVLFPSQRPTPDTRAPFFFSRGLHHA